uniref:CXXC motif containing zinc binding protein isoform X6 n=1 Tax=Myxine glutinosa TaxID=7769 RepID=UPI00358DFFED
MFTIHQLLFTDSLVTCLTSVQETAAIVMKCHAYETPVSVLSGRESNPNWTGSRQVSYLLNVQQKLDSRTQRCIQKLVRSCLPENLSVDEGGFVAEGAKSGTPFLDVNLLEGDWTEYDERASQSVGVYDVKHRFIKA